MFKGKTSNHWAGKSALLAWVAVSAIGAFVPYAAFAKSSLETIKERGYLKCGVSTGVPGFGYVNKEGKWAGFDVDFCRATAAAIFNDPSKVEFTPTTGKTRFSVLQSGEIDLLYRNTTWTASRDMSLGLAFSVVNYYDGQGFIVPKSLGVTSVDQLDGATVCIQQGTTTELNLAEHFKTKGMSYKMVPIETFQQAIQSFKAGRCDVYTTDASGLSAARTTFDNPDDYIVLREIISKEPLGPVVRADDMEFLKIVQWVFFATVLSEEVGVTSKNLPKMLKSPKDEIKRLLGVNKNAAPDIGLPQDYVARVVKAVGNYGEIFERNLGVNTPLSIGRGNNALYTKGGLQYAPPFR